MVQDGKVIESKVMEEMQTEKGKFRIEEEKSQAEDKSCMQDEDCTTCHKMQKLLCLLSSTKARSLVTQLLHATPTTMNLEDTLATALQLLISQNLTSAPVLGPHDSYVGFIDIGSLLSYVVHVSSVDTSQMSMSKNKVFQTTLVSQVMGLAPPGIPFESSLHLALEIMAITGLHRVAVVNYFNNVCSVVTQSMLLKWLYANVDFMPVSMRKANVGVVRKKAFVMYVRENDTLLSAFRLMQRKGVHALAVVDEDDNLVDCVSCNEIQVLGTKSVSFRMLWDTVKDIKIAGKKFPQLDTQMQALDENASFEDALKRMVEKKTPRVFVVKHENNKKQCMNMITATDMLRYVLRHIAGIGLSTEEEKNAIPFTENYYVYAPFGDALMPKSQHELSQLPEATSTLSPATFEHKEVKNQTTPIGSLLKVDAAHDPSYLAEKVAREKQKMLEKQQPKPLPSRSGFQLLTPLAMDPTPPPYAAPAEVSTAPAPAEVSTATAPVTATTAVIHPHSTPLPVPITTPVQSNLGQSVIPDIKTNVEEDEKKELSTPNPSPPVVPVANDDMRSTTGKTVPIRPRHPQQQQQRRQPKQGYKPRGQYNNGYNNNTGNPPYQTRAGGGGPRRNPPQQRWKKIS